MIAVFLTPWPLRGHVAPDLWFFYKALSTIKEPVHFILSDDYFLPLNYFEKTRRWEPKEYNQKKHGYRLPTQAQLDQCQYSKLDNSLFERLLQDYVHPTDFYKAWLTEDIPELSDAFTTILQSLDDLEAVLIWNNCASLQTAAQALNIPVVHMEQGALRSPDYALTFYLDFQGVNGAAEAQKRYLQADDRCKQLHSVDTLRDYFARDLCVPALIPEYDIGVALQVENDSNQVAYGNGYNNITLLEAIRVKYRTSLDKILVRGHPYALFTPNPRAAFRLDESPSSNDFIARCRHIVTINSGLAFEALLLKRPVTLFGEGPFNFIAQTMDEEERCRQLYFYLFAYLVPYALLLDMDYLRFRLSTPSEYEIIQRHKAIWEVSSPHAPRL